MQTVFGGRVRSPAKRFEKELVRGWLHEPDLTPAAPRSRAIVLTHGAGSSREAPLLKAAAEVLAEAGYWTLRCDLAFRQEGRHGPFKAFQARDREGIRRAAEELRKVAPGSLYLGGHSYGGRQSTMLAAEQPDVADALLLMSYPLHPTRQPASLRVEHFPALRTPALFVHGTRDPFGSIEEMREALQLIPARTRLVEVQAAAHGLSPAVTGSLPLWFGEFLETAGLKSA